MYQLGGSLSSDVYSYVERQADKDLYQALKRGEFCYILNSRQMGKSSLLVRAQSRMQAEGGRCASLDLTNLGTHNVTSEQWYRGIGADVCLEFNLFEMPQFLDWWQAQGDIPQLQKLCRLIETVLLPAYPQTPLYVFVDEIDSVLSLDFSVDDWFALIRYCYNQRAIDSRFRQLTFVLAGVATSSELIADTMRTPFNVGYGIELQGFQLAEVTPLTRGLLPTGADADALMTAILHWTRGQPFLTQKLCLLVMLSAQTVDERLANQRLSKENLADESLANENLANQDLAEESLANAPSAKIPVGKEADWVADIVRDRIVSHWETQDEPEHLRTIRDRLLRNEQQAGRLLGLYQKLLIGEPISMDDSADQTELLLSGIARRHQGQLQIKNPIYQAVFDVAWVERQLSALRPYTEMLQAWDDSGQTDISRLLQGQALKDAQQWSRGKRLDDLDYTFLAASEALDRQTEQAAMELAQAQAVEARLHQERRASKFQRYLLGAVSFALVMTTGLGIVAFTQYRRAVRNEQRAEQETIRTLATAARAQVVSDQSLDALVSAARADKRRQLWSLPEQLGDKVALVLQQTIFAAAEQNRLTGHGSNVNDVAFSPDGETLVSGGGDQNLRFWQRDGQLLKSLPIETDKIYAVEFSPDGELLAIAGGGGVSELRSATGEKLASLEGHQATVWFLTFGPKGEQLVTASQDGSIKLWSRQGELLQTIQAHESGAYGADISADQQLIASASTDGTAKLWRPDGRLQATLADHDGPVWAVAFHPDGETVVTTGQDQTVRTWRLDGTPIKTFTGHSAAIWGVEVSSDGERIISTSVDNTAKIWTREGALLETLKGHGSTVWGLDMSPDGNTIATASWDQTIRLWQWPHPLRKTIYGLEGSGSQVVFNQAGSQLVSATLDGAVQLWDNDGQLIRTLGKHGAEVWSVEISSDNTYVVSGSADNTAKLWSLSGELLQTLEGHQDAIYSVDISPDGETIATGSLDGVVKLWRRDGTLVRTLKSDQISLLNLQFSPDGKAIAVGGVGSQFHIWNLEGEIVHSIEQSSSITGLSYSEDGQFLATVNDDNQIRLRRSDGEIVRTFTLDDTETGFSSTIRFSPKGDVLAATVWNTSLQSWQIKLWRTDGSDRKTLTYHRGEIPEIAFSPDGNTLASVSFDKTMMLWNLSDILMLEEGAFVCDWIADYLQTSPDIEEGDRTLCES
ncbi:MAG: AAA-like domain-containing protein [Cyanobacteria bacterium P01_F01_bin.53]